MPPPLCLSGFVFHLAVNSRLSFRYESCLPKALDSVLHQNRCTRVLPACSCSIMLCLLAPQILFILLFSVCQSSPGPCRTLGSISVLSVCCPSPSSVNLLRSLCQRYVCLPLICCSTLPTGHILPSSRVPSLLKSLWTVASLVWALPLGSLN